MGRIIRLGLLLMFAAPATLLARAVEMQNVPAGGWELSPRFLHALSEAIPRVSTQATEIVDTPDHERIQAGKAERPAINNRIADSRAPNVLFIAMDDLNDWVGCLGGHPQAKTPNIDRLAASGVLFANAHCAAPACNPSRTAILTGISPHRSGLYENGQKMREVLPDAELLPKYFSRHGYWSAGSGKVLHYFIDARSWDDYFPPEEQEQPFPRTLYPDTRPVSLPRAGTWQYVETDWGGLDATDEQFGGDWLVSKWIGEQLDKEHDKPFFLACGIYRPHEPWFVPQKYFDLFPLADIQLPPGYREDDLEDLPPAGRRRGPNRYFAHIRAHQQWRQGIQGYLASIAFADAMVGRVVDALENGPNRDNTIVVLWSDHGWHLGEKQHWQKFTAWRVCTRVPLIVRVPAGTPGLPGGTPPGAICNQPVNLVSLFPTLTQLAGLDPKPGNDGPSLVPLLNDARADWPHASITYLNKPGSYGLSTEKWRLIHYANGDEELYDIVNDRYELTNLAGQAEQMTRLAELRGLAPRSFAAAAGDQTAREVIPDAENGFSTYGVEKPAPAMGLSPFYGKYVDASGYPVIGSARVSDYALKEAAYLVDLMLAERPDIRNALVAGGSKMIVMAHDEFTTDIPEHSHLRPKDYWDARARGLGGSLDDPVCSCGEENLLGFEGDPYAAENILIHEFAHNIHWRGMVNLDPTFDERLRRTYQRAMAQGLWQGKYASTNHSEYFAEGVQSWFNNNRPPDHDHNHVDTREELEDYDPGLASICGEVFGKTQVVYTKPKTRLTGHLRGYDPSAAPRFRWPARLDESRKTISEGSRKETG